MAALASQADGAVLAADRRRRERGRHHRENRGGDDDNHQERTHHPRHRLRPGRKYGTKETRRLLLKNLQNHGQ